MTPWWQFWDVGGVWRAIVVVVAYLVLYVGDSYLAPVVFRRPVSGEPAVGGSPALIEPALERS